MPDKGVLIGEEILKLPIKILPISHEDVIKAIELFKELQNNSISPRDAIHAAVLKNNQIQPIVSADKDFDHFDF